MLVIGISKEEMEELRREFKDTQLPDPEMYPQSFEYCLKVLRTLKELNKLSKASCLDLQTP